MKIELINPSEIQEILDSEDGCVSEADDIEHQITCHLDTKDYYLRKYAAIIVKIQNLVSSKIDLEDF